MDRRRGEPHDEAGFVQGEQWLAVIRSGVDQADAGAQHRHAGDDHERTEQAQHGMRWSVPHVRFGTGVVARKPVAGACALQQEWSPVLRKSTVKTHVAHIRQKLELSPREDLGVAYRRLTQG